MQNTLIVIAGPTAIGKTDLTIKLAQKFNSEIVSADSRQVFKELTIGTAVPDEQQLKTVKHHLIQHKSIHDNYNASNYEHDALQTLETLFQKHPIVFMTGGSGMYIEAVCSGIDDMPDIKPKIREEVTKILNEKGKIHLQEILKKEDPEYYYETDIQNPARLIRGVEMLLQTGKPFSLFRKKTQRTRPFKIVRIALDTDRNILHNRINTRVDQMLETGLLDEVRSIMPHRHLTPLKTVGYQEFFEYFDGKVQLEEASELVKRNTRRYARKQL
ncbi:MAG: tRNA (adenosine(37)-N6)-dimethylallyltransferase MiaA, partial [Salinivirgaceae bacterium]